MALRMIEVAAASRPVATPTSIAEAAYLNGYPWEQPTEAPALPVGKAMNAGKVAESRDLPIACGRLLPITSPSA